MHGESLSEQFHFRFHFRFLPRPMWCVGLVWFGSVLLVVVVVSNDGVMMWV
jgi:hypothetical protein